MRAWRAIRCGRRPLKLTVRFSESSESLLALAIEVSMPRVNCIPLATACFALLAGCTTVSPAPGADKIRVTDKPADVAGCTAVGNIHVPKTSSGTVDVIGAITQFRNEVVGLGGTSGFVTSGSLSIPIEGVAYRCP